MVNITHSNFSTENGWTGKSVVMLPVTIEVMEDGEINLHVGDPAREYVAHSNGHQVGTLALVGNRKP